MEQVWERLETEAFTAEREWCVEGIPVLTAAVSLPRPVGPQTRMLRRIRRYYRAQAGRFCATASGSCSPWRRRHIGRPGRPAGPCPVCGGADVLRHLQRRGLLEPLYPVLGADGERPGACCAAGVTHGSFAPDTRRLCGSFFPPRSPWRRLLLDTAAQEICRQEAAAVPGTQRAGGAGSGAAFPR